MPEFILEQYFIPGSAVQVINKTSIVEAHVGLPATVQWLLRGINTSYSLTINKDGDNVILDYIFGHPTVTQQTIYKPIGDSMHSFGFTIGRVKLEHAGTFTIRYMYQNFSVNTTLFVYGKRFPYLTSNSMLYRCHNTFDRFDSSISA